MLPLRNFTPLWKKLLELRFKGFVRAAGIQLLGLPGVRESLKETMPPRAKNSTVPCPNWRPWAAAGGWRQSGLPCVEPFNLRRITSLNQDVPAIIPLCNRAPYLPGGGGQYCRARPVQQPKLHTLLAGSAQPPSIPRQVRQRGRTAT